MEGYWEDDVSPSCSNPMIRATVYKDVDEIIISIANWSDQAQETSINVNWEKLGIDPVKYDIFIPGIRDFQIEQKSVSFDEMSVPGNEGYLILLNK